MSDEARQALAACGTLAEAIRVGLGLTPPWSVVDVIVQDEYTHDVVMMAAPQASVASPAILLDCT